MKKQYIVKKNHEFQKIINKGQLIKSNNYFVYFCKNELQHARIGISVGKKLGNAVVRNKTRRQIRSMINIKDLYGKKIDYIIIVRKNYFMNDYQKNKKVLLETLKK